MEKVHYLPILISFLFLVTFTITFVISALNGDVSPLFPYISDTGTFPPESCIFGQFLNVGAALMAVIAYIRYLQIEDLLVENREVEMNGKLNLYSFVMALIAAFGVSIVGNFQESNVFSVHLIGAWMAFGVGGIYISIQTYIGFKLNSVLNHKLINWVRVTLSIGTHLFFILTFTFAIIQAKNNKEGGPIQPKMTPDQPTWVWRFSSALSEWIMAFCLISFLATFTNDFRKIKLQLLTVEHRNSEKLAT